MVEALQSVALRVLFKVYLSSDHITEATGKTVVVTLSKNGGAFGNPSAGATNATEIANGWYYADLSTTDTGTLGPLVARGSAASCDASEAVYQIVKATNRGMTGIPDVAAGANGGLPTGNASGQVAVASITSTERDAIAAALLDLADGIASGVTPRKAVKRIAAKLCGLTDGAGTDTEKFYDIGQAATAPNLVETDTVTAAGERTAIVFA